jgi:hypothetical protein
MVKRPLALVSPPDAALWYDASRPLALGCTVCPDRTLCGGLRIGAGIFDCRALCACQRGGRKCSGVCRGNHRTFLKRVREVGGFGLDDVRPAAALPVPAIPDYVPIIYDGTNRRKALAGGTVAVPLLSLFNRKSGTGRFEDRAEMLSFFRLSASTRVIATGVDVDRSLERWWSFGDRPRLIETLHGLGIALVTGPNFSLFTDVTRYDNFHNMKRLALTWAEFMAGGITCALHVQGRTDTDYERWTAFVAEREEVSVLAFEFTTGAVGNRGDYHRDRLVALAAAAPRPLRLILRGGSRHLPALTAAFASVSMLDAGPYMKTKQRQKAQLLFGGDVDWKSSPTAKGQPLDDLLRHNIELARYSAGLRRGWIRTDYGRAEHGDVGPLLQPCPA